MQMSFNVQIGDLIYKLHRLSLEHLYEQGLTDPMPMETYTDYFEVI